MNRSITYILVSKILEILESSTLSQIFSGFLLLLASIIITVVFTYTDDSIEAFRAILTWENAIIMKAIVITLFVFNFSRIISVILIKFESILASREEIRTIDSIDGIPRLELMDHLFTVGSFKRDDVESKW
jgi:chromate transport protein ChrA